MNYIGSKKTLLPWIDDIISQRGINLSTCVLGDGFAGTGNVSSYFQQKYNTTIVATDTEYYSWLITHVRLNIPYTKHLQHLVERLQLVKPRVGLVTTHYSPLGNRMYFTTENASKIDGLRETLEEWKSSITLDEFYFLLASVMIASDKVSNISCTYGAYLKEFKQSALKDICVLPIHSNQDLSHKHVVLQQSILDNDWSTCDIVYLDPPYNNRQYGANYFILNYILHYKDVSIRGKTGICDYYKSPFSQKSNVLASFKQMIDTIYSRDKTPLLCISYNDEGLLSKETLMEMLSEYGRVSVYTKTYKKFKAQQSVKKAFVQEYLWILEKA